jgi:hypothetical protein
MGLDAVNARGISEQRVTWADDLAAGTGRDRAVATGYRTR